MKTKLTEEESQHLINLGVPKEKASYYKQTFNKEGGKYPIFKIENFINGEIIPKEIPKDDKNPYCNKYTLFMEWGDIHQQWSVSYCDMLDEEDHFIPDSLKSSEELIDALYKVACWYYRHFLKNKKK